MDGYGKCHECIKFGTMNCPTSSKCLAYDERPFFEPKHKNKEPFRIDEDVKLVLLGLISGVVFGGLMVFTKIVLGW